MHRIFFIAVIFLIASCQSVTVDNFVHEGTEKSRRNLQWSKADPTLGIIRSGVELPYIVPDFYQYWPGYSAQAYIYVVSDETNLIKLKYLSVSSDVKEKLVKELLLEATPRKLEEGLALYRFRVLDEGNNEKFANASTLTVTVKWTDGEDEDKTSTYILKKVSRNETVWKT
jgi:hypothetical protein